MLYSKIFDATGYYMSVTPSAGLSGAGILRRNEALLSGKSLKKLGGNLEMACRPGFVG